MLADKQKDISSINKSIQKEINNIIQLMKKKRSTTGEVEVLTLELKVLLRRLQSAAEEVRDIEWFIRSQGY